MKSEIKILFTFIVISVFLSCNSNSKKDSDKPLEKEVVTVDEKNIVKPENFIRAETDKMFYNISQMAGGINKFYHIRDVTPLDKQTVVRMNKDVLYSGAVVDVEKGASVTFPAMPDKRYASILVIDNDHYCPVVYYKPGKYKLPADTKYMFMAIRIQIYNPNDAKEIAMVNKLKDQFIIESNSAQEFKKPLWDSKSLDSLHVEYEKEFSKYDRYPDDWMGPRGKVNEKTRQYACAGAWGLFPNKDATYINYNGGNLSGSKCYVATYKVPDVSGFWSITVYGKDGFMKSTNSVINASNVKYNADKTFTVYFGAADKCPKDAKNRLDITDGWNFLMRCYLPGKEVLDGTYKLPSVTEVK
ncbi:hypothetical protein HNP37_004770 [Flavobacterium nitrogenifigens]|uniref:DUF1214 domain-containing protein n=2 Tax=Flavobacterium TaxID=237 RepID=A0A7W7J2G3_9FLAO|nr:MULTISPECIES: DUF1254 domain-containing protein [Flavobacterium]MBB4804673.1 hypothetical protein [Flavobacterium nitrogenifigens]MBB6389632.1 hypothetical protein [Flavobacterium notoginsengisoli]